MMLRRFLIVLSGISLAAALTIGVLWWVSYHRTWHYTYGHAGATRHEFVSLNGFVMVTQDQDVGGMVVSRSVPYADKRLIGYCLIVPAMVVLIEIRRRLPRPGSRLPRELR